jgi:hypothetical protein
MKQQIYAAVEFLGQPVKLLDEAGLPNLAN